MVAGRDRLEALIARVKAWDAEVSSIFKESARIRHQAARLGLCESCLERVLADRQPRRCCPGFDRNIGPAARAVLDELKFRRERYHRELSRVAPTIRPVLDEADDALDLCAGCLLAIARDQPPEACCAGFDDAWPASPETGANAHAH